MGGLGGDNMSIIIVCFLHGKPWQNLVDKCKKIHSEKKASSKLSEPAFSAFDRFTADGPFTEVSVLKTSDDLSNANESSSSSHTSSPSSSSPISTEEKFELIAESSTSQIIVSETITTTKTDSETKSTEEPRKIEEGESQGEEIQVSKTASEDILEPTTTTTTSSTDDAIVSNGD